MLHFYMKWELKITLILGCLTVVCLNNCQSTTYALSTNMLI